ncbi:uncharacterized protein LOC135479162 [Liolophura sinensis]|uniref:uncharacterized protein LOC135479162 n=1 Tax=Liolophura sinensis TaxID=3198878 RepID=UPI0031586A13
MRSLAILSVFVVVVYSNTEVSRVETEVVRNNDICPPRAVCADIFDYNQTNQTTGEVVAKRRRVVNCMCPERGECPNQRRYTLHATSRHRQQICESRNSLSRCKNGDIAEQMHVEADLFDGKTYYKMNCRCRRHRNPVPNGGFRDRATELLGRVFEEDHWVHNYVCARSNRRSRSRRTRE